MLSNLVEAGFYTEGQVHQARLYPAQIIEQRQTNSPDWFLDWAYRDTLAVIDAQGLTGDYVLEVKTTINLPLQTAAQNIIKCANKAGLNVSEICLEPIASSEAR